MSEQTETQRLADELVALHGYPLSIKAAAELRRLDAELMRKSDAIQRLWAERDSLRASMAQLLEALEPDRQLLQQALDALENSVDRVLENAYQAEKFYGNYPTRQGKVNGLKVLADDHEKAITALTERLAHCDRCGKKLGGEGDIHTCSPDPIGDAQDKLIAEMAAQKEQEPAAIDWDTKTDTPIMGYTTPPAAQRQWVDLTDEEIQNCYGGNVDDFARALLAKSKERNT